MPLRSSQSMRMTRGDREIKCERETDRHTMEGDEPRQRCEANEKERVEKSQITTWRRLYARKLCMYGFIWRCECVKIYMQGESERGTSNLALAKNYEIYSHSQLSVIRLQLDKLLAIFRITL